MLGMQKPCRDRVWRPDLIWGSMRKTKERNPLSKDLENRSACRDS